MDTLSLLRPTMACWGVSVDALIPSLAALDLDIGMKRKAAASGHWGLSIDSSLAVAMVVLSRLYRTRDEPTLTIGARSPFGLAVLAALRTLALRVAKANGGADAALSDTNVATLFNLGASHVTQQRLYDGGFSLPGRLPWPNAKRLVLALYDALALARTTEVGLRVANLMMQPLPDPASPEAQAAIQALIATVEPAMVARLGEGGGGGGSSGSSSASSTPVPQPPHPPGPPSLPSPPPQPPQPPQPFAIDASLSLLGNIRALLGSRIGRPLTPPELGNLEAALEQALSILQAGGAAAQRQLLATGVLAALIDPGAAQLWASTLEAAESGTADVGTIAQAIVDSCSAVSSALFSAVLSAAVFGAVMGMPD